jgi:hypothetical protein
MIKNWQSFLEANKTEPHEENLLGKYFDLSSEEIQDWIQDFLDEYNELDFEVSVVNPNFFTINFFEVDAMERRIQGNITKEKYPFPEDLLQFLEDRLKEYDCYIDYKRENPRGLLSAVWYAISKQYLSIGVKKSI